MQSHALSHARQPPSPLPGFAHINRYWDSLHQRFAAKILPGEYYVTRREEMIVTVLGSCISACIRCRATAIGGMNHFMLPQSRADGDGTWAGTAVNAATRYGNYAMEHIINDLLKNGASRKYLEVKIVGGGRVLKQMSDGAAEHRIRQSLFAGGGSHRQRRGRRRYLSAQGVLRSRSGKVSVKNYARCPTIPSSSARTSIGVILKSLLWAVTLSCFTGRFDEQDTGGSSR